MHVDSTKNSITICIIIVVDDDDEDDDDGDVDVVVLRCKSLTNCLSMLGQSSADRCSSPFLHN